MLSFVACQALLYFSLSHKRNVFQKRCWTRSVCVLILTTSLSEIFLIMGIIVKMYIGLNVKCPLFFQILMKLEFSRQIFNKYPSKKFQEKPSGGSRVVPTWTEGRTDMTNIKLLFSILQTNWPNQKKKTAYSARRLLNYCQFLDKNFGDIARDILIFRII